MPESNAAAFAARPHTLPGDTLRAMVVECRNLDDLEHVAGVFNSDSLTGRTFRSLPKAVADDVRHLWRGMRCALVWYRTWHSLAEGIARPPVAPQPAQFTPDVNNASQTTTNVVPITSFLARASSEVAPARQPMRAATRTVAAPERRLLASRDLIAGALAKGQGALVSWSRGRAGYRAARLGATSRRELLAALQSISATQLAPSAPSATKQFGEAMRTLNANGLVTRHATRKMGEDVPADVASRFIVGYVDASADLGSLGDKRLIADLTDTGQLRFTGSPTLATKVKADYEARVAEDTYTGTDLALWLERTLRNSYHAVSCGAHLYVPAAHVDTVRALIGAVKGLMGRAFQVIPVTTGEDLISGLVEGLTDEVADIRDRFVRETERARNDNRSTIGERMATTMIRECEGVRERVSGYAAMLGDSAVASVKADLASLLTSLQPLASDGAVRAALLDLN